MIKVKNLTKKFGDLLAVDNVSFEVQAGETLVLLGTSGSGKTTTLRMLNRLLEPTFGEIIIRNESIYAKAPEALRRSMGYVIQGYGLFPHYTVKENIAMVPRLLKWPEEKINQRLTELMVKLQLPTEKYANAYPQDLSGGQKQRVGLARALAANPSIMLMDEPFGALDPITKAGILKQFKELDELETKTIILVTHNVLEAFELGDKICLMDKGKVVQFGKPSELIFKPNNEFVKSFFSQHELQLRLQSLTLKHIWDFLPTSTGHKQYALLSHNNLWLAMTALTEQQEPVLTFDEETKTLKEFTLKDLQQALILKKQSA